MFTVRTIHDTDTIALLCGSPPLTEADHEGVFALAAEERGELVGFAVARSCPKAICFFGLEGDPRTCRFLLQRLVRLAGERDVCGWCSARRADLRRLLEQMSFARQECEPLSDRPMNFYYLDQNS
jgi:hypothetical protein